MAEFAVAIPFSDLTEAHELGSAAYLKLEAAPDYACCVGGLLVISARGEPLEFGYNRVRVPQPFLWRAPDLRNHVQRRLVTSLLSVCSQEPRLLLCLENEVSPMLFSREIRLELPVARLIPGAPKPPVVDTETGEVLDDQDACPAPTAWQPAPPEHGSDAWLLFEHLSSRGLLVEPFDRVVAGLREVYAPAASRSVP